MRFILSCEVSMIKMKVLLSVLLFVIPQVSGLDDFAVMNVKKGKTDSFPVCIMYNAEFHKLPTTEEQAPMMPVADLMPSMFCEDPPSDPIINDHIVLVLRGNCTFVEKARRAQKYGAKAIIIVSIQGLLTPGANTSDTDEINITVATMASVDYFVIKNMSHRLEAELYSPSPPRIDYNLLLIWLLAVFTVVLGSLWSGIARHHQLERKRRRSGESGVPPPDEDDEDEAESLDVSPKVIVVFVILMCGMLLALYMLYDYLVYAIIGLFVVASTLALYSVLKLLLIRMPCVPTCKLPANRLPLLKQRPEVRRIVLLMLCMALGIWWAVERHAWYAWILQDILGIVFCIHMMKTVRLPSLKACTILLSLLFIYDIFFVFITPLFTKSGNSVMVDVATGGDSHSGEQLPMVLKVPRIAPAKSHVCSLPYSLLGFGDILVPGLLISYNHGFDLVVQSSRIYFISSVIAYGVGLVLTFIALALMSTGQPALLYLVPCTLLTTFAIAAKRGEVKKMWSGELLMLDKTQQVPAPPSTGGSQDDNQRGSNVFRRTVSREKAMTSMASGQPDQDTVSHDSTDNEHKHLIPN